jgi:hypothetical protein
MKAKNTKEAVATLPDFASREQAAEWLESEEGQDFFANVEGVRMRLVPKHPEFIPITIRMPADLRARLRGLGEQRGMGYQTMARQWLLERYEQEREAVTAEPKAPRPQRARWRELAEWARAHRSKMSPRERILLNWAVDGYTAFQMAHMMDPYVLVHEVEAQLAALEKRLMSAREEKSRRRRTTVECRQVKVTTGGE